MAELIATGRTPELIAPFSLVRFAVRPRTGRPGVGGNAVAPDARARLSALRPPPARRVRLRRRARTTPSPLSDPEARDFDEVWIFDNPTAGRPSAGSRGGLPRWLTVVRDTSVDRVVEVR
jgi:hypothetical protein